jgi:hypothetical protein
MLTSNRSGFRHWPRRASATNRTAVYGPVCTVVWQGSAGDRCPYADRSAAKKRRKGGLVKSRKKRIAARRPRPGRRRKEG